MTDLALMAYAIGELVGSLREYEEQLFDPVEAFYAEGRVRDYATKDDVLRELKEVAALIEGESQ